MTELATAAAPYAALELGRVLAILYERQAPALGEEKALRLSVVQKAVLEGALEHLPRGEVLLELERFLSQREGVDARRLRLQVLGCMAQADDLAQLFTLAMQEGELELIEDLEAELRPALAKCLGRGQAAGMEALSRQWRHLPDPVVQTLLLAIGDTDSPQGVELLQQIAQWKPTLAFVALAQVRSIGASPDLAVNQRLVDLVQRSLGAAREDQLQLLLQLLGELEDYDSIPTLLEALEAEHKGIAKSAHWALQRLSGLPLAASSALWRQWYERERRWAIMERDEVILDLNSDRLEVTLRAAQELGRHHYERRVLVDALAYGLQSDHALVRMACCKSLGALGSPAAVAPLEYMLQDSDARVAQAALSALRSLGHARVEALEAALLARSQR